MPQHTLTFDKVARTSFPLQAFFPSRVLVRSLQLTARTMGTKHPNHFQNSCDVKCSTTQGQTPRFLGHSSLTSTEHGRQLGITQTDSLRMQLRPAAHFMQITDPAVPMITKPTLWGRTQPSFPQRENHTHTHIHHVHPESRKEINLFPPSALEQLESSSGSPASSPAPARQRPAPSAGGFWAPASRHRPPDEHLTCSKLWPRSPVH